MVWCEQQQCNVGVMVIVRLVSWKKSTGEAGRMEDPAFHVVLCHCS